MILTIDELKTKAKAFLDNKIIVYVRRLNEYSSLENINGYIQEISSDFFIMSDIKDNTTKMVFFLELTKQDSVFAVSNKKISYQGGNSNVL